MAGIEDELKEALTHTELKDRRSESNVEDLPTAFTAGTAGKAQRIEYGICICITKIRDIDMVNGNFFGQGTLHFSWPASDEDIQNFAQDPVGYDPSIKPNWRFSNAISFERELIPYDTGNPYAVLANEDPNVFGNRVRFIDPEGRYNFICYDISGNFAQTFHVQHYPVDTQDCIITIEGVDKVENMLFREPWDIRYETGAISTNHCSAPDYKLHPPKIELNMLRYVSSFATLSFVGKLERIWWLVILRLGLFLMIVSFSCIFSFVMDPIEDIDGRLAHQFVIILTLVAFQFVLNAELPKTPYLTYMDLYSFCCFFYVFVITAAQSIVAYAELSHTVDDIVAILSISVWVIYHLYFAILLIKKRKIEMKKLNHVPADYNEANGLQHCAAAGNYWNVFAHKCFWPEDYPIGPSKIPKHRIES